MNPTVKKIIIVGAGQHGQVVKNCVTQLSSFEFAGFLDDTKTGAEILGGFADFEKYKATHFFHIALGNQIARQALYEKFTASGCHFIALVHPTAKVENSVSLGKNVFVGAMTYINVHSAIGDNSIINNGCIIEHDNQIGSNTHLTPGVVTGGGAKIGNSVFIGLNSTIRDHITIGDNCLIGMGTTVVKNLEPNVQVFNKLEQVKKTI